MEEAAHGLGLTCLRERADVPGHGARRRLSSELAARELRYAFLARAASEVGAGAIALGHTADDQAETVLLHLLPLRRGLFSHGRGARSRVCQILFNACLDLLDLPCGGGVVPGLQVFD